MNPPTIEHVSIKSVALNPDNPRQISSKQFERLVKSLEDRPDLFEARPLLCSDRTGKLVVIGGNMRLRAAQKLGYKEVPVIILRGLDLRAEKEIAIKDNGGFGEWDFDVLANEWSDLPLAEWGVDVPDDWGPDPSESADAEPQIDKAAELNKKWQVKTGDLFQIGDHRLLCGDSTKVEDVGMALSASMADCVFTSPPYAVGVNYGETYQDTIENLRVMLPVLAQTWIDAVRPGGFAVVNFGDIVSASNIVGIKGPCEYPMALEYWPVFRLAGWVLWSRRIWCKPGAGTGSMQCISSNRAAPNWEHIWTWKKDGPAMFEKQTTGDYPSQSGWIDSTHSEGLAVGLKDHGAGMPPLPALFSISNHSLPGGIVFEPFCGTGTTMVAAQNLNRKCYGIEISPDYCAVILERMETAFPGIEIKRIEQ